jgi:peptidoglycan/LPS O-acetylase OafA/YrhL
MPESRPFRLGYHPALDGIRGVAVLAVMFYHFGAPWDQGGFLGVDAFFVLSGFLITSLLVEERARDGRISFGAFYLRRALRLLPALAVMLLASAVVAATILPDDLRDATWRGIAWTVLYAANWQKFFSSASVGMLGHTWSLSIEEQFYLLWPPLLALLLHRGTRPRKLMLLALGLAAASAGTRALLVLGSRETTEQVYNGLHTRADSLLIGCAAALAVSCGLLPGRWPGPARLLAGVGLPLGLLLCFGKADLNATSVYEWGFLPFACAVALLLAGLVAGGVRSYALESKPLVWLGARSYGLYLWHLPVHQVFLTLKIGDGWPTPALLAANAAATVLVAAACYQVVEKPALELKRRLRPRAAAQAAAAVPVTAAEPTYALAPVRVRS